MSANLMVWPCSCPARDTLCSGGQMLSMSQMGQTETSTDWWSMSAPPPIATIKRTSREVRFVPIAEVLDHANMAEVLSISQYAATVPIA